MDLPPQTTGSRAPGAPPAGRSAARPLVGRRGPGRRWPWRAVTGLLVALSVAACGASIQAVYEGDVRFEHCMALDVQPDVKPMIKRACWQEWVAFYTYGQTRDRVRHAQLRIRYLSGVGGDGPSSDPGAGVGPLEAPEPTSALLAPPMTTGDRTDGGAAEPSGEGGQSASSQARSRCLEECEAIRDDCRRECRTVGCHKGCSVGFRGCLGECPP